MGYEIKMLIGSLMSPGKEIKYSTRPYADGSGFEPEKDEHGKTAYTGRSEIVMIIAAEIDLCKIGYMSSPLNDLIAATFKTAKEQRKSTVHAFFATDGNTMIKEDLYEAQMWPASLAEALSAFKAHPDQEYRRIKWAIALLESMVNEPDMSVMFYGH